MLIEIHVLQNHAPSNLNRDDTGSPKSCVFGGVARGRISSQCLKRSIRRSPFYEAVYRDMKAVQAARTQSLPSLVANKLREMQASEAETSAVSSLLPRLLAGTTNAGDDADDKDAASTSEGTKQLVFTYEQEYEAVAAVMLDFLRADTAGFQKLLDDKQKEVKKKRATFAAKVARKMVERQDAQPENIRCSPDLALFGRMTTSAAFVDVQAALQAAHAFSTNKLDNEFDFFTAVDDLKNSLEDDPGAGHLNDTEFNSACYYKYFSIDVDGLIDNLLDAKRRSAEPSAQEMEHIRQVAATIVESFVRAMALTTPTGKQNSFAAHQLPAAILVEVRPFASPVSYANAFVEPARIGRDGDLVRASLQKLGAHVEALTRGFNLESTQRLLLAPEHKEFKIEGVDPATSLNELCASLSRAVAEARAQNASGVGGSDG